MIEAVPAKIQFAILRRMDSSAREDAKFEWHHVMARRDENFTSTDVVTGDYPLRRFIRAGHVGNEWFVWFERGGIAYSKNIALFHLRLGRGVPIVRAFVSYATQNPCTVTDDLLDGSTRSDLGTGQW